MKINEAYVSPEKKKQIATALKPVLSKYGIKATLGVRHNSTIVLKVNSGPIDFINNYVNASISRGVSDNVVSRLTQVFKNKNVSIHRSWVNDSFSGKAKEAMVAIFKSLDTGNHDRSDTMTDYYDVGHYVDVKIGGDKSYVCTGPEEPLTPKTLKALGMSSEEQNVVAPEVKTKPSELENHGASAIAEFYNFKFDSNGVWEWSTEQPELMGNKSKGQEVFRIVSKSPEWKKFKSDGRKTIYMNKTNGGTYIDISNGKEGALVDKMAIATQHIKESNLTEASLGQEQKKLIASKLKPVLAKYGVKGKLSVRGTTVSFNITECPTDLIGDAANVMARAVIYEPHYYVDVKNLLKNKRVQVNDRQIVNQFSGKARTILVAISNVLNINNYTKSDWTDDWVQYGYHVNITIGSYEAPFVCTGTPEKPNDQLKTILGDQTVKESKLTEDAKQLIQNPILKVFEQFGKQYLAQVLDASLNKMIQAAARRGVKVTVQQLIAQIQQNPNGETAKTLFKAMATVIKQISAQIPTIVTTNVSSISEGRLTENEVIDSSDGVPDEILKQAKRTKDYYPYRIVFIVKDKNTKQWDVWAKPTMHSANKLAREGHEVHIVQRQ
jgi:hypothetical protein